jgi:hypothetical protein
VIGEPLFWAAAVPAVLLAGLGKASGNGLGMLAVPMMALAMPPSAAAAVMLPLLVAMDLLGLWAWRGQADAATLRVVLPGALVGIAIGSLAFFALDVRWVKALLGAGSRSRCTGSSRATRSRPRPRARRRAGSAASGARSPGSPARSRTRATRR